MRGVFQLGARRWRRRGLQDAVPGVRVREPDGENKGAVERE